MIYEEFGSILDVPFGLIIQQANAQMRMGSGVALAIKEKWPVVETDYLRESKTEMFDFKRLGMVVISQVEENLFVASIIGQRFYGASGECYTSYDALRVGFEKINSWIRTSPDGKKLKKLADGLPFVHTPLLGCDRGGGKWPVVRELIDSYIKFDAVLWKV